MDYSNPILLIIVLLYTSTSAGWGQQTYKSHPECFNLRVPACTDRDGDGGGDCFECKDHREAPIVCDGEYIDFESSFNPSGSISWTIESGSHLITYAQNIGSDLRRRFYVGSNAGGYVIVRASASGQYVEYRFWAGHPASASVVNGPSTADEDERLYYNTPAIDGACSYEWSAPYPFTSNAEAEEDRASWGIRAYNGSRYMSAYAGPQDGLVQVVGVNPCGAGGGADVFVTTDDGGTTSGPGPGPGDGQVPLVQANPDAPIFRLFPNPARARLTLQVIPAADTDLDDVDVSIINSVGAQILRTQIQIGSFDIDVSDFTPGLYTARFAADQLMHEAKFIVD